MLNEVVISGNVFKGIFEVRNTNTVSSGVFQKLIFNNNCCTTVRLYTANANLTDYIADGTFVGNTISSSFNIGDSVEKSHRYTRITFCSNTGAGSVNIPTDTNNQYYDVMIIGNAMNGSLTIGDATTSYTSPPNTYHPMIALNRFGSYNNISFTANKAIGWGTGTTGTGAANEIEGSNL